MGALFAEKPRRARGARETTLLDDENLLPDNDTPFGEEEREDKIFGHFFLPVSSAS